MTHSFLDLASEYLQKTYHLELIHLQITPSICKEYEAKGTTSEEMIEHYAEVYGLRKASHICQ